MEVIRCGGTVLPKSLVFLKSENGKVQAIEKMLDAFEKDPEGNYEKVYQELNDFDNGWKRLELENAKFLSEHPEIEVA